MRKKFAAALVSAAVLVSAAGCASVEQRTDDTNVTARYVDLPDGRQAVCVFWVSTTNSATGGGSIECDFGAER